MSEENNVEINIKDAIDKLIESRAKAMKPPQNPHQTNTPYQSAPAIQKSAQSPVIEDETTALLKAISAQMNTAGQTAQTKDDPKMIPRKQAAEILIKKMGMTKILSVMLAIFPVLMFFLNIWIALFIMIACCVIGVIVMFRVNREIAILKAKYQIFGTGFFSKIIPQYNQYQNNQMNQQNQNDRGI